MDIGGESAICIGGPHNEEQLNISDVFEAITLADPSFGVGAGAVDENMSRRDQPYVEVVEQPASKALRFRYECEGRSAGSIPGVNSTSDNKTYPTIKICGYTGQAVIVVSCVTKDEPYKAHPHNLVGREHCVMGVCTIPPVRVTEETCEYQFKNLGIQCVKRRDIADALTAREKLRVDPFRKNFDHKNHPQSIDLNAVRLCFQVFLPDESGRLRRPLKPVVSDVIYDKKAMSDLLIMRSSHCSGTARGGTQVILLCEKVTREDIEVVFYQEENGVVVWEEVAIRILVHKQVAIAFETPPYKFPHTTDHISAHFQLKRTSDNARSNSLPFEYIPEYTDSSNNKRRKVVTEMLRTYERLYSSDHQPIKSEPRDRTPPHHNISSPPLHTFAPHYEQNWGLENMQPGMGGPGPSHVNPAGHGNPFVQEMWQNQSYGQVSAVHLQPPTITQNLQVLQPNMGQAMSPNMQPMSPNMQPLSPNMQPLSPNMQQTYAAERMSPNMSVLSPHAQSMSPNMNVLSPHAQSMSPGMGVLSPHAQVLSPGMHGAPALGRVSPNMPQNMGHMSPNMPQNMGHMSPNMPQNMGHISPNLVQHQQPTYAQQQQAQQNLMEQDGHSAASLTNLLLDRADGSLLLNSSELSGLSALLGERGQEPQPLDY